MAKLVAMWRDWRNRLLMSPRFQRAAAAFPLTRPLARREARGLFDVVAGFVYSQVLLSCVRLGVLDVAPGAVVEVVGVADGGEGTVAAALSVGGRARLYSASAPKWRNGRRSGLKIRRP